MREKNQAVRPETIRISLLDTYDGGTGVVLFESVTGNFEGRYHMVPDSEAGVIWVGGAGGGLDGPARGLYPRMADLLKKRGIASLRLDYRRPGDFSACVVDVMAGVEFLVLNGHGRIALVGHSFGGAVVIAAGEASSRVTAVAALSSQTHGTSAVSRLTPRPVIFLHGTEDTVLPDTCSRELFRKAGEPKELKLYAGCGHGLDECRSQVDDDLEEWLLRVLMAQHAFHR
jgi:dienelactone hydrolase